MWHPQGQCGPVPPGWAAACHHSLSLGYQHPFPILQKPLVFHQGWRGQASSIPRATVRSQATTSPMLLPAVSLSACHPPLCDKWAPRDCLRARHSCSLFKHSPSWESFSLGLNSEKRDSEQRTNLGSRQNYGLPVLPTTAGLQTELAFFSLNKEGRSLEIN